MACKWRWTIVALGASSWDDLGQLGVSDDTKLFGVDVWSCVSPWGVISCLLGIATGRTGLSCFSFRFGSFFVDRR